MILIIDQIVIMDVQGKRKCDRLFKFLQEQLRLSGLESKFRVNPQEDSYEQLERVIREMIFTLEEPDEDMKNQLQMQIKQNEAIIIECLKCFFSVHQELNGFSKLIYDQECSLEVYKSFRKLYETVSMTSNTLYQYESQDEGFLQHKEQLISKNLQINQQIFKASDKNKQMVLIPQFKNRQPQYSQTSVVEELKQEIQALNEILRQNDEEFGAQIQKYNNTLYDLQETIREYEIRMDKMRDYENIVEDLEHKIIRFKEEKYRDEMLIDNMSRKIRAYQKQRGGSEIFLSPRAGKRTMNSPNSRLLNNSATSNTYEFMKNRHLVGQKI